jgi:uncharacterized protein (TIGR02996 family)
MDQADFIRAILDEPDDDTTRLVFADWLEEHGQADRAEWVRASCQRAKVRYDHPSFREVVLLERECFQRCRPPWWQEVTGVLQQQDRGMFRFEIGSKTAATRLGKVRWLGDALAGGWLEGISIRWCDGSLARVLAKWNGAAREVPLFVRPAPQIGDEGLAFYLDVPHLWGLDLPAHAMRNPSVLRLGQRHDLRELRLAGTPAKDRIAAVFEQVGELVGLRRLTVDGYWQVTEDDLRPFGRLSGLRELQFHGCHGLTDAGLVPLHQLTGLRRLELYGCEGVSGAAVTELQQALPALQVERL